MDHLPLVVDVIEFYREPWHLHFKAWMRADRPLPRGTALLLELAAEDERVRRLGIAPEEFNEAQHFFIRQVLFAQGSDHYRTLGLADAASARDVRTHYRKLMRLFHPDLHPGEWYESYVTRLNEAYAVLSDADRRRRYDRERLAAAVLRPRVRPTVVEKVEPRGLARRRFVFQWRPRWAAFAVQVRGAASRTLAFLRRYTRLARVMGSLVSVLLAIVWLASQWWAVNLSRPRPGAPMVHAPVTSISDAPRPDSAQALEQSVFPSAVVPIDDGVVFAEGTKERGTSSAMGTVESRPAAGSAPIAVQREHELVAERPVKVKVEQREGKGGREKATGMLLVTKASEKVTLKPSVRGANRATSVPSKGAAGAGSFHAPAETLTAHELTSLLDLLAYAYRSGDIDAFLALFADDAQIANESGREGMRKQYAELFESSTDRHFFMQHMRWRIDGTKAKGTGTFRINLRRDAVPETYKGQLTVYVEKGSYGPLITEFYYEYGELP